MARARSKKRLSSSARMDDARRWLKDGIRVSLLTDAYMKRYGVERCVAEEELSVMGYAEEVKIENYERQGIEWEYQYDPYVGELRPVPKGTDEHELHLF